MMTSLYATETYKSRGFIATHLTPSRLAILRDRALEANAGLPILPRPNFKEKSWPKDPFGNVNAKNPGMNVSRPRWAVCYNATISLFDLPWGVRYVPCYITGEIGDAWTFDQEHVGGRLISGTAPGLMLLASHQGNASKDDRSVGNAARALVSDLTGHTRWIAYTPAIIDPFWHAYPRRRSGDMPSTLI